MISTVLDKRYYIPSFNKKPFKMNILLHKLWGKKMGLGVGRGGWANKIDRWLWKHSRNCPLSLSCMKI